MTPQTPKKTRTHVTQARKLLGEARTSGDQAQISIAAANLGFAFFQAQKYKEGARSFYEAEQISGGLNDFNLRVHVLGIKTAALQATEQYPRAFETARSIQVFAERKGESGVQSDALATQGQILLDSGDEVGALEKLTAALQIIEKIDDKRRHMNIMGAFGNYCLAVAAADRAEPYFMQARDLARELGDRQAEIGFQGNLGMLLEWTGDYLQARDVFEEVLAFMVETGNTVAEVQAVRHLVQVFTKLKADEDIVQYAQRGVVVAETIGDKNNFFFYEHLIPALYRLERIAEAQQASEAAIESAWVINDREKELALLLELGESYLLANKLNDALMTYQQALDVTDRLQRVENRAFLFGRIGMLLAECGHLDEAIVYHQQAVDLAREQAIPILEGEQLVMLAFAYLEKADFERARSLGKTAVAVYSQANLPDDVAKAQHLLTKIDGARLN